MLLFVPVVALPNLSVIIAAIIIVSSSSKPEISSKSVLAVPDAATSMVTAVLRSSSSMVYGAPRFAKFPPSFLPKSCIVPSSRD